MVAIAMMRTQYQQVNSVEYEATRWRRMRESEMAKLALNQYVT